ncbi:MAG: T9SS type A sorting domain-containing protein [Ignavibacteriaceae bacterium]|nr:T9SS type A sorting domain-containing protein [Ignavibacteriaceae bacterium]
MKYYRNEISGYLEGLLTDKNYYTVVEKIFGDDFLKNNQFDSAIVAYNNVIKNTTASYEGISARFEKLFAYLHIKKDLTTASQILSEIKGLNSEDSEVQMRIELADRLINGLSKVMKKNAKTVKVNIPTTYELYQNYPNPFNPSTTIRYQIPNPGFVTLKVYDILGREVITLVNEYKIEGSYDFTFDASRFSSGVYIYQVRVNDFVSSKKMLLVK